MWRQEQVKQRRLSRKAQGKNKGVISARRMESRHDTKPLEDQLRPAKYAVHSQEQRTAAAPTCTPARSSGKDPLPHLRKSRCRPRRRQTRSRPRRRLPFRDPSAGQEGQAVAAHARRSNSPSLPERGKARKGTRASQHRAQAPYRSVRPRSGLGIRVH